MPTVSAMPPADRCFARVEKFQCACPGCGRLLTSSQDQGHLSGALLDASQRSARQRAIQRQRRHAQKHQVTRRIGSASRLTWNPFTQRLRCPHCHNHFVVGLVFYAATNAGRPASDDLPDDTVPTRAERLELRRLAGGWYTEEVRTCGGPVNLRVTGACGCPPRGWTSDCPLHGTATAEPDPVPV